MNTQHNPNIAWYIKSTMVMRHFGEYIEHEREEKPFEDYMFASTYFSEEPYRKEVTFSDNL